MKEQNPLHLENIADILWLSKFTGMQSVVAEKIENKKQEEPKPKPKIDDEVEEDKDSSEPEMEEPQDDLELHTDNQDDNSSHTKQKKAKAIQSPKKLALSNYREWEKAFKFINLKQPSKNRYELDEERTVENIASLGVFDLVFKQVQEKSFFLTIVIDRGETMKLWDELIKNFEQMLLTMGVFARVSIYFWDTKDTKPKLYADRELKREIFQKLVTIDGKRNLVWVMSDCIAPSWRSGESFRSIDRWSKKSFTSVLQMFPKEMWMGTMLFRGKHIRLSSVSFNSVNKKLKTKPSKKEKNALKIPIVSFDPYALQAWAKVVINTKNNSISGIELEDLDFPLVESVPKKEITPKMRMQRFYSQASPTAQKLAFYMSVLPIDFKVTRILQEERLPKSNQAHVAEVFLGGIIERTKRDNNIYYDFYPKIREELNANISADDSFEIMKSMSDFVSSHLGIGFDFKALLTDPDGAFEGDVEISSESLAYARLASRVLKRKGGKFYNVAKSLDENIDKVKKEKREEVQLSLADVVSIEVGKSYGKEVYTNDLSGIPLIRVATLKKDIKDMQLLETDDFDRIDRNKLKNSSKKIANECILFATINHNGHKPTIFRPTKNMPFIYIGTDMYGLMISSDKLLLEYLYFLLYSEKILHQIRNYLTYGIMPRLNKTNLEKLLKNIPLISLEEQRQYIKIQKQVSLENSVFKKLREVSYINTNLRRHYKEAITTIIDEIINENKRIVLSLDLGAIRHIVLLEVLNKLYKIEKKPKVLFLSDDFYALEHMKTTLKILDEKSIFLSYNQHDDKTSKMYFSDYQNMERLINYYNRDFFDFIIIDEIPRPRDRVIKRNRWKSILKYFTSSTFISFTTSYSNKMKDYFGKEQYRFFISENLDFFREEQKLKRKKLEEEVKQKRRKKELELEWNMISNSFKIDTLKAFIAKYPESIYAEEAKQRETYLLNLSPFERKLEELRGKEKNKSKVSFLWTSIKKGLFNDELYEALKKLQQMMKDDKKWKEVSRAKNIQKDKWYWRTREVIKMLESCSNSRGTD